MTELRIGHGFDVHRIVSGRALILGGVDIPWEMGLLGHSDADVLVHAVADALLGAAGLGDIGQHFPDSDPEFEGADSLNVLLARVVALLDSHGFRVVNIDATIIAQRPKMAPYIPQMREKIAKCCRVDAGRVNVKATTTEHLGYTGRGEGIAAHAVCLIEQIEK